MLVLILLYPPYSLAYIAFPRVPASHPEPEGSEVGKSALVSAHLQLPECGLVPWAGHKNTLKNTTFSTEMSC